MMSLCFTPNEGSEDVTAQEHMHYATAADSVIAGAP